MAHRLVAPDHLAIVIGDGSQHGRDHLGIGRQRDVFLCAGVDGGDGGLGIGVDAAGDDRRVDVLGRKPRHQRRDVDRDIDHQEIGAASGAQDRKRLVGIVGVRHRCALVHGVFGGERELTLEGSDDEEAHMRDPY